MRKLTVLARALLCSTLVLAVSGCGGNKGSEDSAEAQGGAAAVAVAGGTVECKDLPAWAPLMEDAKVTVCTRAETRPGHVSGSVTFTSAKSPAEIIDFYRAKAAEQGLKPGMSTETAFSAIDGSKRSMAVFPSAGEGGMTGAVLNWGMDQ